MTLPTPPLYTGDLETDLERLKTYINDIVDTLRNLDTSILETFDVQDLLDGGITP